ncbi:MAG TPA: hypothetical protein DDY24_12420 [Alcaligenaceae bacterium]|nr:hypothetical protein [Alcaligenaceae bacterium]
MVHHSFQWIQGALGIITALGMTRLITSAVHMHLARRKIKLDWVPFVWALNIFFLLLQFSWVFVALESIVAEWAFGLFLMLLCFVLTLFVAAALVLPNTDGQAGQSLQTWFQEDGRWSLPFLGLYAFLGYPFNWYFGGQTPETNPASAILMLMAAIAFFTKSRKVLATVTIADLLLTGGIVLEMILVA